MKFYNSSEFDNSNPLNKIPVYTVLNIDQDAKGHFILI